MNGDIGVLVTESNYNQFINAKKVELGINVHIEEGTYIGAIGGKADYVLLGDNVYIGKDCTILLPVFTLGDYCTIHRQCRISGYNCCNIGHNFWMDQNCIINCTDKVTIGNNVGIGAYSQLWSHIKFGDVMEGCRFNSTKPMVIGDDVWFVGHCIVAPIKAATRSMALIGSVITGDMKENHIYGGTPATDLTEKLGTQFANRTIEQKMGWIQNQFKEFCISHPDAVNQIKIVDKINNTDLIESNSSIFEVSSRTYIKRRNELEISFMKFLLPLSKFIPKGD